MSASGISTHALREEGDKAILNDDHSLADFYPRPPRGGRPGLGFAHHDAILISTHALREEGDRCRSASTVSGSGFLPTPSARRATLCVSARRADLRDFYPRPPRGGRPIHPPLSSCWNKISTHALREEGDPVFLSQALVDILISTHALREEGDFFPARTPIRLVIFLPTPSARRATVFFLCVFVV